MVLLGRLTKDAVVAQLKGERKVVNFILAVNDYYKPKNNDKGVTYFSSVFTHCKRFNFLLFSLILLEKPI
jgi:single-stranded DNA-binding protein